ncbi:hypothetical protein BUALT_Bualt04G0054400 [Buddleja alternifolia]|uniref:NADH dehydrogenase-like complex O n=1 Tax=Buddleja alternifolia TaxID=168488 RepID=A0AAV6XXE6_9LAMI|nr:hypothetical protein BUALT_Bualt04G0054400 [Buddleja alternifolia]
MAFSTALAQSSFASISTFSQNPRKVSIRLPVIKAVKSSEQPAQNEKVAEAKVQEASSSNAQPTTKAAPKPKKPVYSMKKGQIVRVDKEKYLNSINVLDLRIFETGECALIAWVGVPTAPAWLPTDMLIKSDKLDYERI